ncbi:MAG: M48 family metallopeptidase [Hydrogenibacillus schlegelii]|uniref:M48 family metallopeptidase n=1 Tax=Hydrogenibacillus schlegelii TaxID=1484 RepID=A0A947CZK5_HYDSH|nr:M48 family metallopeptidase [Hydrogenibacillus schlegelii]
MQYPNDEKILVHHKEKWYFAVCLVISIAVYAALIVSVKGIPYLIALVVLSVFVHALAMAHLRLNGVRLSPRQFPEVYERIGRLCAQMGLPAVPDVYVVQSGGVLNAFATRFFRRNMIVVYADIFELTATGADDVLEFVIAHELAHLKRRHITKHMLLLPAQWIPFLGKAYSRACEYTCDRIAAFITGNTDAAVNGLIMLAVGKGLYQRVNVGEYLHQSEQNRGFFTWLAEKVSTHPPLPKRIAEVRRFMAGVTPKSFSLAGGQPVGTGP